MACWLASTTAWADKLPVNNFKVSNPYTHKGIVRTDTVNFQGRHYDDNEGLERTVSVRMWKNGTDVAATEGRLPLASLEKPAVRLIGFTFENSRFAKLRVWTKGNAARTIYIDNQEVNGEQSIVPGRHEVAMKVITEANEADTLQVMIESKQSEYITVNPTGKRLYTLADYMNGEKTGGASLSSSGRYLILYTSFTRADAQRENKTQLIDLKTGNTSVINSFKQWTSTGDCYITERKGVNGEFIYETVDPATGKTTYLATNYTGESGHFLRGEREMVINHTDEGPKEDPQVHQIVMPDDRQPGWRKRNNIRFLNVETGQLIRLTEGTRNVYVSFSPDQRRLALTVRTDDLTERPFSFSSVLLYDRDTEKVDTLVRRDGFISQVAFSADGNKLYITGSPEAFDGVGMNDPTGKVPSMVQTELFEMDLASRQVRSLTCDFDPNIKSFNICRSNGNIYALCENRDCQAMYCYSPKTDKWSQLKLSECFVKNYAIASEKPMLCYIGQGDSNADRLYTVDLKTGKETLVRDWNEERMGEIALGECKDWNFQSSRGDTIYGRYYLPPHFDPSKKYPMLVYYYGGCSPTGRTLESYYNHHGWAAMGYVVYVIQPSGCTGFGQEFAARHVNTYGQGTADDIIEGTKQFCKEHPYVNEKKIGCLGASYGGFMTMYLMTVTDIFAASMSHAGISNPTSYWGFGYWGYSYNATAAANSYPWNNEKLLSGQAPLFRADKAHTPILFLHGAADTNVPINESIQMFTALKILGRECAFVTVEGQDHHILDYEKQRKWVNTYYAWFAKWLQDDPTWWDSMYPKKNL